MVSGCTLNTGTLAAAEQTSYSLWSSLSQGIILVTGILLFAALAVFLYKNMFIFV